MALSCSTLYHIRGLYKQSQYKVKVILNPKKVKDLPYLNFLSKKMNRKEYIEKNMTNRGQFGSFNGCYHLGINLQQSTNSGTRIFNISGAANNFQDKSRCSFRMYSSINFSSFS